MCELNWSCLFKHKIWFDLEYWVLLGYYSLCHTSHYLNFLCSSQVSIRVADLCWNPVNLTHSLASDVASYNPCLRCLNLNIHLSSRTRTLPMCLNIVPCDIFLMNMNPLLHVTPLYQVKNNAIKLWIWLIIINPGTDCMFTNISQMLGNKIAFKNLKDWNHTDYIIWPNVAKLERKTT